VTNNAAPVGFTDTKQHYAILDGLRGVAALMVVAFHLFEAHAASRFEQIINHGYLAVDFFFVLSGFVIGYAYDDRWRTMSTMEFSRRLIRLHPMIVVAMLIGAALFYVQASAAFPISRPHQRG
jgi:peptidoglycan/LPS O-acetylase OafA/YrhL